MLKNITFTKTIVCFVRYVAFCYFLMCASTSVLALLEFGTSKDIQIMFDGR
jgi:hypothetical protein